MSQPDFAKLRIRVIRLASELAPQCGALVTQIGEPPRVRVQMFDFGSGEAVGASPPVHLEVLAGMSDNLLRELLMLWSKGRLHLSHHDANQAA